MSKRRRYYTLDVVEVEYNDATIDEKVEACPNAFDVKLLDRMIILKRIFSSSWMLVIKDAKPLVLASRDTFIASTSRSSALLTLFNATQFRVPKGDVMPAEIRAQVDVAKKIPGGTLKFTTRKKLLEDSAGGISSYRCCLKLRSYLAILVIRVEKKVGEVYAMI